MHISEAQLSEKDFQIARFSPSRAPSILLFERNGEVLNLFLHLLPWEKKEKKSTIHKRNWREHCGPYVFVFPKHTFRYGNFQHRKYLRVCWVNVGSRFPPMEPSCYGAPLHTDPASLESSVYFERLIDTYVLARTSGWHTAHSTLHVNSLVSNALQLPEEFRKGLLSVWFFWASSSYLTLWLTLITVFVILNGFQPLFTLP